MLKRLSWIFTLLLVPFVGSAQCTLEISSGNMTDTLLATLPVREIKSLPDGYIVTYTFNRATLIDDDLFPNAKQWRMEGFGVNGTSSEPSFLLRNDVFPIPDDVSLKVETLDSSYVDYPYELAPARHPLFENDNVGYTSENIHPISTMQSFFPASVAKINGIQKYRGQRLGYISIYPIQYNHSTRTVRAYTSITYKLSFGAFAFDNDSPKASSKESYISDNDHFLENICSALGTKRKNIPSNHENDALLNNNYYLIISTPNYAEATYRFADWKRLMGFNVIVSLRDNWTPTEVQSVVEENWALHPSLEYLLIIGDHNAVPGKVSTLGHQHITDFHYGCMDADSVPEIKRGRLPVSSATEANIVVNKIINYQQTPPTPASFYSNAAHCAKYDVAVNYQNETVSGFVKTSEDVRNYMLQIGKNIKQIYTKDPIAEPTYWNRFYHWRRLLPDDLRYTFSWDGNAQKVINALNEGVFYLLYNGHGSTTGWNYPFYFPNDSLMLTNENRLPVVFSMACLTGKFDQNCFAQKLLSNENGGCVGMFAASEESYGGFSDAFLAGMIDAIWPNPGCRIEYYGVREPMTPTPFPTYTLGQILDQGLARLCETYGSSDTHLYMKEIFHCFGDPSMQIYTEMPTAFENLDIVRDSTGVFVSQNDINEARITIYNIQNDSVFSFIGNRVSVSTPTPNDYVVCVSAHNKIPSINYPPILYLQNKTIDTPKTFISNKIIVGSNVDINKPSGNVNFNGGRITLKANEIILDKGTNVNVPANLIITNH